MSQQGAFHKVTFLPENKTIEVPDRITIFETILERNPQNIQLRFACGAEGVCRKCKIRSLQEMGPLTPTEKGCLTEEELRRGIRLACQARVIQDTQVEILYKMPFSIELVDEAIGSGALNPRIKKVYVPAGSTTALLPGLICEYLRNAGSADIELQTVVEVLEKKKSDTCVPCTGCTAVVIGQELVALESGDTTDRQYAVAVDLGVNTIVASLIDMCHGKKIAHVTDTSPHLEYGEQYEHRVALIAEDIMNLEVLYEEMVLRLDILIVELCRARAVDPAHVYEIVLTGHTGMLHLVLKNANSVLEQSATGASGFQAGAVELKSAAHARVYALPVISSYVGADVTAGILATRLHRSKETALLIDFGSDTKAVLHHHGRIAASSVYGCGVFDGTNITCGMRPETGAIYRAQIDTSIHVAVIGESLPRGICGSGLLELVAALKTKGIIDVRGEYVSDSPAVVAAGSGVPAVCTIDDMFALRLYSDTDDFNADVYITQRDITQMLKAKAHVVALMRTLTEAFGITFNHIDRVIISGAFGPCVDIGSFFTLGFLPACLQGRVVFAGNTAKRGAQLALLDRMLRDEAEAIAQQVICIHPPIATCSETDMSFAVSG
ncbi:MAG: ASKHA domain-containing protein [Desulfobacterota bacterium]|nr:ASKHA domain-containing protein [Thermodesulfobacteriota bacterium]